MKNKLVINKVKVDGSTLMIDFRVSDSLSKYFDNKNEFYCDYGFNLNEIDSSILVIPFMSNVLPLMWLTNSDIFVDYVDESFVISSLKIYDEFKKLYPQLNFFDTKIIAKYRKNTFEGKNATAMLFSGGVDAHFTMLKNLDSKPKLITYQWKNEDKTGLLNNNKKIADQYNLDFFGVKTNVKHFLVEKEVDQLVSINKNTFWHDLQHGVGLLGLAAPIIAKEKVKNLYIASSYKMKDGLVVPNGSNPITDSLFEFSDCITIHDGAEYDRQDKLKSIGKLIKVNNLDLKLNVCAHGDLENINCMECMKCHRTILGIISNGDDPKKFGFDITPITLNKIKMNIKYKEFISRNHIAEYFIPIQLKISKLGKQYEYYNDVKWIEKYNFNRTNYSVVKFIFNFLRLLKRKISK